METHEQAEERATSTAPQIAIQAEQPPPPVREFDPVLYLKDAMEFAPNSPRRDLYDEGDVVATIDRKRGIVTLAPKVHSVRAWDVRRIALTDEIDATLAFCDSSGSASFRQDDESWFYTWSYLHGLWFDAPMSRMTRAQAAMRIFDAKSAYLADQGKGLGNMHDGRYIDDDIVSVALNHRVLSDGHRVERSGGETTFVLDFAFLPYVRPGDSTEYMRYETENAVTVGMIVLCATLPEDLDPKGAKLEPLVTRYDRADYNFDGVEYVDRRGRVIPESRRRQIGVAVAYTPKGEEPQHCHRGLQFLDYANPKERTKPARTDLGWSRGDGERMLFKCHDRMSEADLAYFFDVAIGGQGTDRSRDWWHKKEAKPFTQGVRFKDLPKWAPTFHTAEFTVTKDAPPVGSIFYAAWKEDHEYKEGRTVAWHYTGLAVFDGEKAWCDDFAPRPLSEVRVVGHATKIGFDAREESAPDIDLAKLPAILAPEPEGLRLAA